MAEAGVKLGALILNVKEVAPTLSLIPPKREEVG